MHCFVFAIVFHNSELVCVRSLVGWIVQKLDVINRMLSNSFDRRYSNIHWKCYLAYSFEEFEQVSVKPKQIDKTLLKTVHFLVDVI